MDIIFVVIRTAGPKSERVAAPVRAYRDEKEAAGRTAQANAIAPEAHALYRKLRNRRPHGGTSGFVIGEKATAPVIFPDELAAGQAEDVAAVKRFVAERGLDGHGIDGSGEWAQEERFHYEAIELH